MTKRNLTSPVSVPRVPAMCAVLLAGVLWLGAAGCSGDGRSSGDTPDAPGSGAPGTTGYPDRQHNSRADSRPGGSTAIGSGPCTLEFSYAIGTIDPRFRISRSEVQRSVEKALALWAGAVDDLTVRHHEGVRAADQARNIIHFDYDERQQRSDRARRFQDNIASKSDFIGQMHADYEREQREVERRMEEHQRLSDRLNERIARFNTWVEGVNETGGFRPEQLEEHERELRAIEAKQERERGLRADLERAVAAVNRSADRLNLEVAFHDDMVRQFYREFGDEFRFNSAEYRFDGTRGTISVYHFHNRRELKVLLAHEIGHALGLGHVPDSRSIMYETIRDQMLGAQITLSDEDIRAVRALCR